MLYIFPVILFIGFIISLIGLVSPQAITFMVKFNNDLQGVKTHISPTTLKAARFMCGVMMLVCVIASYIFFTYLLPDAQQTELKIRNTQEFFNIDK